MVLPFLGRIRVFGVSFALFCFSLFLTAYTRKNPSLGSVGASVVAQLLSPAESLNAAVSLYLGDIVGEYVELTGVKRENDRLRQRLASLEPRYSALLEFQHENRRLRRLLRIKRDTGLHGVVARVVGYDPSNWVEAITIDKGARDGVQTGMAVVEGHGVVGQVTAVSPGNAKVLLMTDPASGIDALVQSSRVRGIVEGRGENEAALRFVLATDEVRVGDRVITSGADGVYPKGLLVGRVRSLEAEKRTRMFKSVVIEPAVRFARLEEVLVVTTKVIAAVDESEESEIIRGREH